MISNILLVEDSPDDVFFMKRAFKVAGITQQLHVVEDGEKALDYLAGKGSYTDRARFPQPGLVLLDLRLPRVPGFDVLKWMRQSPLFQCIPIIVLTSSKEDRDMQRAYALGANSFLVKPSDSTALVTMVKVMIDYWTHFNAVPHPCAEPLAQEV